MDTEHLRVFAEVVKRGSFAAAARAIDIDPSAATRAVTSLEKDLGIRLLERTTRKLVLTDAGKTYHESACKLLDDLQQAADEARDLASSPSGVVRVTASTSYGYVVILPLLSAIREAHPLLEIDLLLTDSVVDLVAERVDVALRLRQEVDSSLIGTRLTKFRYRVCASPGYLRQYGSPRSLAELEKRECLRCPIYDHRWKFRGHEGEVQVIDPGGWLVVSNSLTLQRAALDGVGPALLPDWLVKPDLDAGRLIDLFPDYEVTPTDFDHAVWLLYTSRSYVPTRIRAFVEFMKNQMRGPAATHNASARTPIFLP